jgi:hypothetical protein
MIEPSMRQQILERRRDLERLASCSSSLARTVCSTCGRSGTGSSGVWAWEPPRRWAGDARAAGGGVQARTVFSIAEEMVLICSVWPATSLPRSMKISLTSLTVV